MAAVWMFLIAITGIWITFVDGRPSRPPKLESSYVQEDLSTQIECKEYEREATRNCAWAAGLNFFADEIIDGGKIFAYKIEWRRHRWSDWYIPGVNDIDKKYNTNDKECDPLEYKANSMRRMWSFFYDHKHVYIICNR